MHKRKQHVFSGVIFGCAALALTGCAEQGATKTPVSPPLYLQIGEKTSPLFGPGGFTEARQQNSKLSRSGQPEPKSNEPKTNKTRAPRAESSTSNSPGP